MAVLLPSSQLSHVRNPHSLTHITTFTLESQTLSLIWISLKCPTVVGKGSCARGEGMLTDINKQVVLGRSEGGE